MYSLNYCMCNIDQIYLEGVFSQGSWMLLNDLEDPELKILASKLPSTILRKHYQEISWSVQTMEDLGYIPQPCLYPSKVTGGCPVFAACGRGDQIKICRGGSLPCFSMGSFYSRLIITIITPICEGYIGRSSTLPC